LRPALRPLWASTPGDPPGKFEDPDGSRAEAANRIIDGDYGDYVKPILTNVSEMSRDDWERYVVANGTKLDDIDKSTIPEVDVEVRAVLSLCGCVKCTVSSTSLCVVS